MRSVVPARSSTETVTAAILLSAYGTLVARLAGDYVRACGESGSGHGDFIVGLMLSQGSTMSAMPFAAVFAASVVAALALPMPAANSRTRSRTARELAAVESTPRPGRPPGHDSLMVTVGAIVVAVVAAAWPH